MITTIIGTMSLVALLIIIGVSISIYWQIKSNQKKILQLRVRLQAIAEKEEKG